MFSATHPPRCSARLATTRHHLVNSLVAILLSLTCGALSVATAKPSAPVEESPTRFVGPPSRLQPRLTNETGAPRDILLAATPKVTVVANPVRQTQIVLPVEPPQMPVEPPQVKDAEILPQAEYESDPQLNEEIYAGEAMAPGTVQSVPCYVARPLSSLSISIALPEGALPENMARACAANMGAVNDMRLEYGWSQFDFHWAASCLCHAPLYFEETNAERYGYTPSHVLQPFISAGRFFLTIPALPYKMMVDRPHDCIYTLGLYRPGNCAPRRWNHLPLNIAAAAVEVGVIAGMIAIFP